MRCFCNQEQLAAADDTSSPGDAKLCERLCERSGSPVSGSAKAESISPAVLPLVSVAPAVPGSGERAGVRPGQQQQQQQQQAVRRTGGKQRGGDQRQQQQQVQDQNQRERDESEVCAEEQRAKAHQAAAAAKRRIHDRRRKEKAAQAELQVKAHLHFAGVSTAFVSLRQCIFYCRRLSNAGKHGPRRRRWQQPPGGGSGGSGRYRQCRCRVFPPTASPLNLVFPMPFSLL